MHVYKKKLRPISLRAGLTLAFIFIISVTVLSLGFFSFEYAKNQFRSELEIKIKAITNAAASLINVKKHEAIRSQEDENSEAYNEIKTILQKIKNANQDVRFIYTMRRNADGKKTFVVDAETNPKDMSHVGDEYNEEVPQLENTFLTGETLVDESFLKDKWGTWLSGYAPVLNEKKEIEAIVGIDIAASHVLAKEKKMLNIIILISLGVFALGVILAYIFAAKISNTLRELNLEVIKIQNLDLSDSLHVRSFIFEIEQVIKTVEGMKKGLRSFKKYVPSELVLDIIRDQKEANLSAEKRNITVMFTDITNFTGIAEKLSSEQLSKNYSEYLEKCSDVIRENNGTIDKYIGDAIMAIWGAPQQNMNHVYDACVAAIKVQTVLRELNQQLVLKKMPAFETRIGLSSGECIVGNIGHEQRLSYTAIGDTVNTANRIENLNKNYNTGILVSEEIYEQVNQYFNFRYVDEVKVRGKLALVKIYELQSEKEMAISI